MRRAAAAVAAACVLLAGCGEGSEPVESGDVHWVKTPQVFTPETLPDDRVATGRVMNEGLEPFKVDAEKLKLYDEDGNTVEGQAIFSRGYSHPLASLRRGDLPNPIPNEPYLRGTKVNIAPGKAVPLTVSWRLKDGGKPPVRVDYGTGSLPLR